MPVVIYRQQISPWITSFLKKIALGYECVVKNKKQGISGQISILKHQIERNKILNSRKVCFCVVASKNQY